MSEYNVMAGSALFFNNLRLVVTGGGWLKGTQNPAPPTEEWNKWRENHPDIIPNLRGANLI
jgi:hypothetical protein